MSAIAFFGSSLLSAYWNGAATYYRGIIRALAARGHAVTFYEPDVYDRQAHRDIDPPPWARVVVYEGTVPALKAVAREAARADVVVKASGVGFEDDLLLAEVMRHARPGALRVFWDVDAPATLAEMRAAPGHPTRAALTSLDLVLTYGGGEPVVRAYRELGARACVPIYNALDPETHHPVAPAPRFEADLAFLGNRLPDRDARVAEFFLRPAEASPDRSFLVGGSGWGDVPMPPNVRKLGHVPTAEHNALNCTPRLLLNVARDSMAATGFSPPRGSSRRPARAPASSRTPGRHRAVLETRRGGAGGARRTGRGRPRGLRDPRGGPPHRAGGARARPRSPHLRPPRRRGRRALCGPRPGAPVSRPLDLVVLGLSVTSAWGNGHATTFRSLLRGLAAEGHRVLFLERDVPWYATHRDLPAPPFCDLALYGDLDAMLDAYGDRLRAADAVIVGSFVPEGAALIDRLNAMGLRALLFYDIDTPVTLAKLDAGDEAYLAARQVPLFDAYLSFAGGEVLQHLERVRGARRAEALYCSVDPEAYPHDPERSGAGT
jgi:spore maturation protein CgeB